MDISVFDLFKIGVGPSSSHTVGPMLSAKVFLDELIDRQHLERVDKIKIKLFGSLGATGRGHATDRAVVLGLMGLNPTSIDPDISYPAYDTAVSENTLLLNNSHSIVFNYQNDIEFLGRQILPYHSNGLTFFAYGTKGDLLYEETLYSIGGGFIVRDKECNEPAIQHSRPGPYPFDTADELLELCATHGYSISQLMFENERSWRSASDITTDIMTLHRVMNECIDAGMKSDGILPGSLKVKKRAHELHDKLLTSKSNDPLVALDWINVYAIAVNEENASGRRMVTAPTNGAAGVVPAVLRYCCEYCIDHNEEKIMDFFLTATAFAKLCKQNASISGAEVGCQGEIGSACAMAAAGLAAAMGGSPEQIENAAEIGMEHHLGLTCDPIGGLVQVPCIERNAIGAVHAVDSARLALQGDGSHFVSFDKVVKTMLETGKDMQTKYKETSEGGLAVNITEC